MQFAVPDSGCGLWAPGRCVCVCVCVRARALSSSGRILVFAHAAHTTPPEPHACHTQFCMFCWGKKSNKPCSRPRPVKLRQPPQRRKNTSLFPLRPGPQFQSRAVNTKGRKKILLTLAPTVKRCVSGDDGTCLVSCSRRAGPTSRDFAFATKRPTAWMSAGTV